MHAYYNSYVYSYRSYKFIRFLVMRNAISINFLYVGRPSVMIASSSMAGLASLRSKLPQCCKESK